jgi:hypothetical protein
MSYGSPSGHGELLGQPTSIYPTSQPRSVDSTLEENHAAKQEERTSEAQVSPQENQDRKGVEAARSDKGRKGRWEKPRRGHPPVYTRGQTQQTGLHQGLRPERTQTRTLKKGDRVAVIGHGIAVVEQVDAKEVHIVLGNRLVLRIARKEMVVNEQNNRWECGATEARGYQACE